MKNSLSKIALIALASIGVSSQALADDHFYVGVAASQAFVDEFGLDDDDTGGKAFAGYKFNQYFSIEAAYADFGDIEENGAEFSVDGPSLAVIGTLPLNEKVSVFAKAGVHDWDAEARGPIATQLSDDSDSDAFYGLGINYNFYQNWSVRGEVERYEVEDLDLDVASIGFIFSF